jgi:hypothetical protein
LSPFHAPIDHLETIIAHELWWPETSVAISAVSVTLIMSARATTVASYRGFKINQIDGITALTRRRDADAGTASGRSTEQAATAAPDKIQFNGIVGLRT